MKSDKTAVLQVPRGKAQLQKQECVQGARTPSYKRCQNHCAESSLLFPSYWQQSYLQPFTVLQNCCLGSHQAQQFTQAAQI